MTERASLTNGTGTREGRRAAVARPANGRNTTQPNLQERGSGLPERALNYASTGALEDPARPWKRELDDMIQRDPQIQAVMIALILPLLTAEGHVEPGDKDSGEAEFIEQCLTAPEWDGGMTTPIHMILEQEATAMFYRQAFFEKVWLRDADGKFRYKKLAFRPATTCRIRHDIGEGPNGSGNGSFNGFMQEGVRPGSGEWFTEEFDPLYAYVFVHGHAQRPLLGTSLLQTAWHEHMHKNKLRWLQFRGFAKWGNGILVSETERMDDTEQDALTDALNEVLDGGALVVGTGEMPQLLTASGSAGFLEVLQYIDTGIARSVLLQALQLGTGSNTGSWALSKDHTDFYLMSCEARLRQIEYTRNAYMIPPLIEQNYPGTPSYPTWHFPGLSEEGKELAKEIFIALLGRPQASVHPVIKATVEKSVAQKLGGDPDNIPEWDDPKREVEQVPPDAAADTEPTNDPQRAAEAGALASSLQALRGETGQRAASEAREQGDTPLGESVTYERFLELADLYGDDEAERMLREYVRDREGKFARIPGGAIPGKRPIANPKLAKMWAGQKWRAWEQDLTPVQREHFERYTSGEHREINEALRRGNDSDPSVGVMDHALEDSRVPPGGGVMVHRAFNDPDMWRLYEEGGLEDEEFVDDGFTSTTLDPDALDRFEGSITGTQGDLIEAEIVIPPGVKAAYMAELTRQPDEAELLLARGTVFRVSDAYHYEGDAGRIMHVKMEVVGQR